MAPQIGDVKPLEDDHPLGLLLVDGPNVMIKIKELWASSDEERPSNFGLTYDAVAEYIRHKFGLLADDFQKTIYIKKVSETGPDDESVDKQDKFRYALERDGWDVRVRAPALNTYYGDKENDIDDDLLSLGQAFLEEAIAGDVLVIMTNDFAPSPNGSSTRRILENAEKLGLRTAVISFLPIAPELHRAKFEVIDSRDIPNAFEVPPPLPPVQRTIADVEPGTIEAFDKFAVKVLGRRHNKVESASGVVGESSAASTTGRSDSPRRPIPAPPRPTTYPQRSIPTSPRPTNLTDPRQELMDATFHQSTAWVK